MFSFDARFRMKLQERSLSVAFAGITKDQKLMPTGAISNSPLSVSDTGRFAALILPANDELSTLLSCGLRLMRSEEHTSELQSLMRISYAVFCLKKKNKKQKQNQ